MSYLCAVDSHDVNRPAKQAAVAALCGVLLFTLRIEHTTSQYNYPFMGNDMVVAIVAVALHDRSRYRRLSDRVSPTTDGAGRKLTSLLSVIVIEVC